MSTPEPPRTPEDPLADQPRGCPQQGHRRRNRALTILAALAVAGAGVWALVNYVPDYVARHLVNSELEAMGIDTEGAKTLNLRPWNNEIWMGPVGLRPLDSDVKPAAVGRLGIKYDLWDLFERRALITDMTIEGIDIEVERAADGTITINGIPLGAFTRPEQQPRADTPEEAGRRWDAGLDVLVITDSRVHFEDAGRGSLTMEVETLTLRGFRTWAPETPGTFELSATLNDIDIDAIGEARPFGDEIMLSFVTDVDRGSWDKVAVYTGPALDFERRGGRFTAQGKHQLDFTEDGTITFFSKTIFTINDVVAVRPDGIGGEYDAGVLTLDTVTSLDADGNVEVLGSTTHAIEDLRLTMPDGQKATAGAVNAIFDNFKVEIDGDGRTAIRVRPGFAARDVRLEGETEATLERLAIDLGEVNAATSADGASMTLSGATHLGALSVSAPAPMALDALRVDLANVKVRTQAGSVTVDGAGAAGADGLEVAGPFPVKAERAQAELSGFELRTTGDARQWRAAGTAEIRGLAVDRTDDDFAKGRAERLTLTAARVDHNLTVAAEALVIAALQAQLTDALVKALGGEQSPETASDASPDPSVKLGRFALVDGARILFVDTSATPEVEVSVAAETLEIKNIDTAEPGQHTDIKLVADVNGFSDVTVDGWVAPLAEAPTFDLDVSVQGLQLAPFSPYAANALGMHLDSGTLSTRANARADGGRLNAAVNLVLGDLDLDPVSAASAEALKARIGLSPATAMAMLQDRDGVIRLDLPVSGTVADPQIDLGGVIRKAIGGAFGALVGRGGDGDGGLAFEPITFEAGSTALTQEGIDMAGNLAGMLRQRPKLSVDVCGRVTGRDLRAYAESRGIALPAATAKGAESVPDEARRFLERLAVERTRAVRQYVATGHGIDPSRVEECRPTFDPADPGPPRVAIKM